MSVKRKKFFWTDPVSKRKFLIETTPDLVSILEHVIDTQDQADSFFKHYSAVWNDEKRAERNLGYHLQLIKDKDVREDAFDLFLIDSWIHPDFILPKEYSISEKVRNS